MRELKFRVWHKKEKKMYWRGYQKLTHVLLCDDDKGSNDGNGTPVKRAPYEDCELLESTTFFDRDHRNEIYEGDVIRVRVKDKTFTGVVTYVPDMFGTKALHPLESVLTPNGIPGNPQGVEVELLGNRYEDPELTRSPN